MTNRIQFLHHSPGRVRVHVDGLKGDARLGQLITGMGGKVVGVTGVTANPLTGSVLILYDRGDALAVDRLKGMVSQAEELLDRYSRDPNSFSGGDEAPAALGHASRRA